MERRGLAGLLSGLAGCAFGAVAAVAESPVLTLVAAVCALGAAASSLALLQRARLAERRAAVALAELGARSRLDLSVPNHTRSVIDPETGLPDARFFELALEGRIAVARRRLWPLAVVLVELDQGPAQPRAEALASFAVLARRTLREADVTCRLGSGTFGLLLEDTNESGGVWAAERLQAALARDRADGRRLAAGVASYPTHGLEAEQVLNQARGALARACAAATGKGPGPVEVARVDLR
jgi:diguanylate cyclase (GGDEF)-like protein